MYHAIYCLKTVVLTFMSAKKLEKFCRDVEKTARCIGSDGIVRSLPPGSHGDVRVVMRDAMMATANSKKKVASGRGDDDGDGNGRGKGNRSTIVASVDSVLDVLVKTLMLRRQQVEENLKRLFTAGDDNGDGVLSYDEFLNIIQAKRPGISERRVLRMFKMALLEGADNSESISRETFVNVRAWRMVLMFQHTTDIRTHPHFNYRRVDSTASQLSST